MVRVLQTPRAPLVATDDDLDEARPSGFDGRVWCSSLADLVQLECLSGARAVISVLSPGRRGTLFFNAGAVCHATVGDLTQEEAALEILSWEYGTFEQALVGQASAPWPDRAPIAASWQQLVMCAAQRRDEAAPRAEGASPPTSWVRPLPAPRATRAASPAAIEGHSIEGHSIEGRSIEGHSIDGRRIEGHRIDGQRVDGQRIEAQSAVLLGAQDEVLAARGAALSGLAIYLRRLTTLIAEDLGAQGPAGLVLEGDAQLLLMSSSEGGCVAFDLNNRLTLREAAQCLRSPATFRAVAAALAGEEPANALEF